jgi:hypothetical protein
MANEEKYGTILLDVASGSGGYEQDLLERFGHPVRVCHGPEHGTVCPLLSGTTCDAFEDAHGVIFELDLDRPQHRAILRRYRELARPDVPIRAVVSAEQAERYRATLDGIEIYTHESTVADLDGFASEVEAADRT